MRMVHSSLYGMARLSRERKPVARQNINHGNSDRIASDLQRFFSVEKEVVGSKIIHFQGPIDGFDLCQDLKVRTWHFQQ